MSQCVGYACHGVVVQLGDGGVEESRHHHGMADLYRHRFYGYAAGGLGVDDRAELHFRQSGDGQVVICMGAGIVCQRRHVGVGRTDAGGAGSMGHAC